MFKAPHQLALALLAVAAWICCSPAFAQTERNSVRPYASMRLTLENADANLFVFEHGYGGVGSFGVHLSDRIRAELSISRRGSDIIQVGPVLTEGYYRAWAWLLNAYYHPFGIDRRISPYIGAAGAFNHSSVEALSVDPDPRRAGLGFPEQRYFEKSWQGKVGIAWCLAPGVYLDTAAAYFVSDDHFVDSTFANNVQVESAYRTYSALVGLRVMLD